MGLAWNVDDDDVLVLVLLLVVRVGEVDGRGLVVFLGEGDEVTLDALDLENPVGSRLIPLVDADRPACCESRLSLALPLLIDLPSEDGSACVTATDEGPA